MSQAPLPIAPGEVLNGKYRIESVLGHGAMGVVLGAIHLQLDQLVAIKFLIAGGLDPHMRERFAREARAVSKIQSEHVARVMDVGVLDSGIPYTVMEHLAGEDLGKMLRARGTLPVPEAVNYILQACEALAEAHVVGIVHRDLKPANVFVARRADGSACVKLLDFGISKFETDGADGALTNGETVFGSPAYMPPEQIRSTRDVDARGDLWSLGATLFELLVGRPPFRADTLPELCVRILEERTPDLACLLPGVPPGLDATVHRCLAKERDARFATVAELASALEPFAPEEARLSVRRIARIMGGSGRAAAAAHPKTMPALDFEIERFQEARTMRSDDGVVVPAQPQARLGDDVGGSTPTSTEWRHRKPKWLPAFFAVGAGAAVVGAVAIAGPLRSGPMPPPQQVSAAPPDSTPTSIAFRGAAQPSTAPARSDVVEIPAALVSVAPAPWRARGPAPSVAVRPSTVARPAGAAAPSASASREVKENAKTQPELAPLDTEGFGDRK